jgi:hypothetical protein
LKLQSVLTLNIKIPSFLTTSPRRTLNVSSQSASNLLAILTSGTGSTCWWTRHNIQDESFPNFG